jgi:hypothetical protein
MSLREIQFKWIDKFDEMRRTNIGDRLAAPFLSVPGERDGSISFGPILLVGKATAGCWKLNEFLLNSSGPVDKRVAERLEATREHLNSMKVHQPSAFWRFWKALGAISSPVIWTNQAKIGVTLGNPRGPCFTAQADLACETLQAEIDEYRPSLVVIAGELATNEIILRVLGKRPLWNEPTEELCWIDRNASRPTALWINHPERKPKRKVSCWLEKAQELILQPH